ncbi:MAG: hypothetical protein Q8N47_24915 [Bryobacterales bacterium]|nr:hypothetical protein [Bryobacterales bacterium]
MGHLSLVVALLVTAGQIPARAGERIKLRLPWSELGPAVADRKISMRLSSGTAVEGKVLGVEPEALRLHVTWSTDDKVVRKGKTSIPRSSISVIRMGRYSKHWRLLLTPGLPAALLGGMAVGVSMHHYSPAPQQIVPIGIGVTLGGTIAGYYLGKRLDRRELTEITIVGGGATR